MTASSRPNSAPDDGCSGLRYNSSDGYFYGTLQSGGTFGGGAIYKVSASATHDMLEFGY